MSTHREQPAEIGWTLSQRRALLALLGVFLVFLCIRLATNRAYVSDPQPPLGARAGELASRIDPNSADWQTLATIPTLGEKRAKAIVEYRDHLQRTASRASVFKGATDLLRVRGIGPASVENLKPYLIFPADPTTARLK